MKRSRPLRRTPLRASQAPLPARKRIRRQSVKAAGMVEARRDVIMAVHLRDGYRCQAETIWAEVPCGGALHVHEPLPRSRGGDPLDVDQCVTICARHHESVHQHPELARARGLTL